MPIDTAQEVISRLWQGIGCAEPAPYVAVTGHDRVLPSAFDVTTFATASVAVAQLAAAELLAARTDTTPAPVSVSSREACAAFVSEALFTPIGWERPPVWDPIAGDYRTADGWIRLHTNYAYHRAAVERVLPGASDREAVTAAVATWRGDDLESALVGEGGCAAVMHDRAAWLASAPGAAAGREPLTRWKRHPARTLRQIPEAARPFSGIRVLDLTRVIAGPVCTRFLAAYGAEVLRIDPPGFVEVPALLPETTTGKRCTALDLTSPADRVVFEYLISGADVIVHGLRPDALAGLGYDPKALRALNPALITARLDAYGWDGPWQSRRGFDSLVQMSCGIASAGAQAAGSDRPTPLPAQALDHGTGYLLAAAIGHALVELLHDSTSADISCSLVGTSNVLTSLPDPEGINGIHPTWGEDDTAPDNTVWGPARRAPLPGRINGIGHDWRIQAGPLGRAIAKWAA